MPTAYRARALANWRFNCTCSLCTAPARERAASDRRRERLVEILNTMETDERTHYDDLVALTREFVGILERERMQSRAGEYYRTFMRVYWQFGDVESAIRYGQAALRYSAPFADPDSSFVAGLRDSIRYMERIQQQEQEQEQSGSAGA